MVIRRQNERIPSIDIILNYVSDTYRQEQTHFCRLKVTVYGNHQIFIDIVKITPY